MVWVSQEQPAARSGQEKSQLQPGEPAASSQQCQEQPGGESGGEPGAARRATASSHQCQEQPGEPAAARSNSSNSFTQVTETGSGFSSHNAITRNQRAGFPYREGSLQMHIDSDSADKVSESGFCSQGSTELSRILQSVRPFELRLFSAKNHTLDSLSGSSY